MKFILFKFFRDYYYNHKTICKYMDADNIYKNIHELLKVIC
jgi:hypothetical protein